MAWPFVLSGDVAGLPATAPKVANYYTAHEGLYTAGVMRGHPPAPDGVIPADAPSEVITLDQLPPDPHTDPERHEPA